MPCQREDGRPDSFAVAVVRGEAIVGHVLKKTSVCSLYLRLGWNYGYKPTPCHYA